MDTFEANWSRVKPVVQKLMYQKPIYQIEWQHLFSDIHQICTWDEHGPHKLLKVLRREFKRLLRNEIRLKLIFIEDGLQLLKTYSCEWNNYSQHCDRFPIAFQQLDLATKNFILGEPPKNSNPEEIVKRKNGDSTVRTLLLKLWNDLIVSKLYSKLTDSVSDLISQERNGKIVNSQLVISVRDSYIQLDDLKMTNYKTCYIKTFLDAYIEEINIYYSVRAPDYLLSMGVLNYVKWASERVKLEMKRGELYLNPNQAAQESIAEACRETMIAKFVDQLVRESVHYMESQSIANLKLMFDFVQLYQPCAELVLKEFGYYIEKKFMSQMKADKNQTDLHSRDISYIEIILDTYSQASRLVVEAFNNSKEASATVDNCVQKLINDVQVLAEVGDPRLLTSHRETTPESRIPEMMALYCEWCLRNSSGVTSFSTDLKLVDTLPIILLLKNSESFIRYHRIFLTRRLILSTIRDIEKEEEFCRQLRDPQTMPHEELNRIHRMFKDVKASSEFQSQYISNLKGCQDNSTEIMNLNNNNSNNNNNNESQIKLESKVKIEPQVKLEPQVESEPQKILESPAKLVCKKDDKLLIRKAIKQELDNEKKYSDVIKSIKILNPSCWPSSQTDSQCNIKLPDSISSMQKDIEKFYRSLYSDKKLVWSKKLSNGIVTFTSNKGKYDLHVNALQYTVLELLGNHDDPVTYEHLVQTGQMDKIELKRALWSLVANPKLQHQLVNCYPFVVDDINKLHLEQNKYSINKDFVLTKNGLALVKGRVNVIGRLQIS